MSIISRFGHKTRHAVACAVLMAPAVAVWAQGAPIEDDELGDVWGQAMFSVTNTDADAVAGIPFDFTKITLNADVKLNANFSNIELGKQASSTDLSIGELRFVSGLAGENYVSIKDPYIEFVYKNQNSATVTDREIIGMRMGFGEISGNLGVKLNNLKGQMVLQDGSTTGAGTLTLNSATTTSVFQCATCAGGTQAMNMVGQIQANKSTDFFVSILTEAVSNFGGTGQSAPAGISINWQNNLKYMDLSGVVMPNPLPPLSVRQGG